MRWLRHSDDNELEQLVTVTIVLLVDSSKLTKESLGEVKKRVLVCLLNVTDAQTYF